MRSDNVNFFKNWFLNFIKIIIVALGTTLMGVIFYWLYQSLVGEIILIIIFISLIMAIVDTYL